MDLIKTLKSWVNLLLFLCSCIPCQSTESPFLSQRNLAGKENKTYLSPKTCIHFYYDAAKYNRGQPDHLQCIKTGAIIGDGDRERAPFLVLGLSLWYGSIFLFLEQIAPSRAAQRVHAARIFADVARRNGVRNSRNVWYFWPLTTQYFYVCWNFASVFSS